MSVPNGRTLSNSSGFCTDIQLFLPLLAGWPKGTHMHSLVWKCTENGHQWILSPACLTQDRIVCGSGQPLQPLLSLLLLPLLLLLLFLLLQQLILLGYLLGDLHLFFFSLQSHDSDGTPLVMYYQTS